jgi:hypothetical protein
VVSVGLTVAASVTGGVGGGWFLLGLAASLCLVGFYGTQRVWYAAVWDEHRFTLEDAYTTSRAMFGRYFRTGILVGVPFVLVGLVIETPLWFGAGRSSLVYPISTLVLTALLDALLTFVTPALAFTTADPARAWRIGTAMIRATWPGSALYVLTPAIALQAAALLSPTRFGVAAGSGIAAATALFALWWKGATAAYYRREGPA